MKASNNGSFCLEELSQKGFVLFDTSALLRSWGDCGKSSEFLSHLICSSADFYIKNLNNGGAGKLFITSGIKEEYLSFHERKGSQLVKLFEHNDSVINIQDLEPCSYDNLWSLYYPLKNRLLLSDVDYDFITSGLVLSLVQPNDSYFLVSNDRAILETIQIIGQAEKIGDRFHPCLRVEFNSFERSYPGVAIN